MMTYLPLSPVKEEARVTASTASSSVFEENGKFFCEYWVIPVDGASQRNVGAAYDMAEFLVRNHIQVSKLTATYQGAIFSEASVLFRPRRKNSIWRR